MTDSGDFSGDCEFVKLLARRADIDLTLLALEIARDEYPALNFTKVLSWIEERADELAGPVAGASNEKDVLREVALCLSGRFHLHGKKTDLSRPESSYLNRVVETGRGIPISLSLVYMAVCGKLRIELLGVATPCHFLTVFETMEGPLFLDAYSHGNIMSRDQCLVWLAETYSLSVDDIKRKLKPVEERAIVTRLLNNLKYLHTECHNWTQAWYVQHRLAALQPASYRETRDLAWISLKANRPGEALSLYENCLKTCPYDEQQMIEKQIVAASTRVAQCN